MQYKRLHLRVPATGDAILSSGEEVRVKATVINVSVGGFCISAPSQVLDQIEYDVKIVTPSRATIDFTGNPTYQTEEHVGIKITSIDKENLLKIYQRIEDFELTEEFIKQVGEEDLLKDWFIDEGGDVISIRFETEADESDQQDDPDPDKM